MPTYRFRDTSTFTLESFTDLAVETKLLLALSKHLYKSRKIEIFNQLSILLIEFQGLIHSRKVHLRFCGNRSTGRPFYDRMANAFQIETHDPWAQRIDYKKLDTSVIRLNLLPPNTLITDSSLGKYLAVDIMDNFRQGKRLFIPTYYDNSGIEPYRNRLNRSIIKRSEELLVQRANELSNSKGLKTFYCVMRYTENNARLHGNEMSVAVAYKIFINLPNFSFKRNDFADFMGIE